MSHTPWLERTHKNHPADSGNWLEVGVWEDTAQLRAGWVSGAPGPHPGVWGRCDFTPYLCEETEPKAWEGWDGSVLTPLRALWSVWWVQNWGWGKDSDQWVWRGPCPGVGSLLQPLDLIEDEALLIIQYMFIEYLHMVGKVLDVEEETLNRSDLEMMS